MQVLFATSEVATFFKIGGLADVSLSLPVALSQLGVHVSVTMPYYKTLSIKDVRGIGSVTVDFAGRREIVFIFATRLTPTGPMLYLFRHPWLMTYQSEKIVTTFAFYSKAVATFYQMAETLLGHGFDVVHCHDWHTALIPVLLGERNKTRRSTETIQSKTVKTIMTLHNLLYQGVAAASLIDDLGIGRDAIHMFGKGREIQVCLLREGLEYADAISTVSPTYAKEIIHKDHGTYIGTVLVKRQDDVHGILNGIDPRAWDPASDAALPKRYSAATVYRVKPFVKASLQKEVGLPTKEVPLFGFVGRIEPHQKGVDILIAALGQLLAGHMMQMVVLGTGDSKTEHAMSKLAKAYKDKLSFVDAFDEPLARRIYAGADTLVVPSKFEPCGLTQMIAMHYGTLPLVRATGGLKDTVTDGVTGFVFEGYTGSALSETMEKAMLLWAGDTIIWRQMMKKAMHGDVSWGKRAKQYKHLYTSLVKE